MRKINRIFYLENLRKSKAKPSTNERNSEQKSIVSHAILQKENENITFEKIKKKYSLRDFEKEKKQHI